MLGMPGRGRAATLAEIKPRGSLVVAMEDDFQPFEFFQNNVLTGYDVELLQLIAQKFPFKVTRRGGALEDSARCHDRKIRYRRDRHVVTKERLAALDMTTPVAKSVNYYLKRTRDTHITGIKDLSGLKLGVEAGSAMLAQLPQLDAMLQKTGGHLGPVQQYQDYPSAYQDLANGRLDYVVNTQLNLASVAKERPEVFSSASRFPRRPIFPGRAEGQHGTAQSVQYGAAGRPQGRLDVQAAAEMVWHDVRIDA